MFQLAVGAAAAATIMFVANQLAGSVWAIPAALLVTLFGVVLTLADHERDRR